MNAIMPVVHWLQHHSVLFMFIVFALLVATVYWPGRQGRFDHDAQIPLEDDA